MKLDKELIIFHFKELEIDWKKQNEKHSAQGVRTNSSEDIYKEVITILGIV